MWLIDEAHKLTGDAQNALLKMLEDPPDHVYFMLATTDPNKLLPTIRTRATEIKMKSLNARDMGILLKRTVENEQGAVILTDELRDKIIDLADGSPRKALVLLNQVLIEEDEESALAALAGGVAEQEGIDLARMLLAGNTSWAAVAKVLKAIPDLETQAEGIRRLVLAYMSSVALGGGKGAAKAVEVIDCFRMPYYDTGKAGLVLSCWDAIATGK
jgi:DNA polymerase III gamma/tau subunit